MKIHQNFAFIVRFWDIQSFNVEEWIIRKRKIKEANVNKDIPPDQVGTSETEKTDEAKGKWMEIKRKTQRRERRRRFVCSAKWFQYEFDKQELTVPMPNSRFPEKGGGTAQKVEKATEAKNWIISSEAYHCNSDIQLMYHVYASNLTYN
ncbi:hypothetical protein RND71_010984 [Anisodus tanguticus]|uniref:Uncharacterized protein n=1 Tax=Anisodus tanguticus TaxID=243964 RepID=A0AAE1SKT2_9SOLA|nr:hypothetical protein RND71_010984 [Anisodus tanguticus]